MTRLLVSLLLAALSPCQTNIGWARWNVVTPLQSNRMLLIADTTRRPVEPIPTKLVSVGSPSPWATQLDLHVELIMIYRPQGQDRTEIRIRDVTNANIGPWVTMEDPHSFAPVVSYPFHLEPMGILDPTDYLFETRSRQPPGLLFIIFRLERSG